MLRTERLILRDITDGDLAGIVREANNLEVSRHLLIMPFPYTEEDGKEFITFCKNTAGNEPRTDYIMGIELQEGNKLIGVIGLHHLDSFQGTGQMGYWLGEAHWRQGFMSEAMDGMIKYAFHSLDLRRINIEAFVENEGSLKLIERAGFQYEGTGRRKCRCLATGRLHDVKFFGLLKEDLSGNNH